MSKPTTFWDSCLSKFSAMSRFKAFSRETSSTFSPSTRAIAQISAVGLVVASAGFGAVYAWSTGSHHGVALACLMVLMAVALELAKPLSVAAAFAAFRSWSVVRGAALASLATVAIGYSLTAELSLMATSRGDVVATREASIKAATDVELEAQRARDRYDRARAELDTLAVTRPASELQAEIDGLLLTPGADGCVVINGRVTREVCPKVADLRAEKARAERRADLEAVLATPLPSLTSAAELTVGKPDPAASALAAYLAVLGIVVAPAMLSEWLVLVPVLALEIGSAFAVLLVQAVSGPTRAVQPISRPGEVPVNVVTGSAAGNRKHEAAPTLVQAPTAKPVQQVVQPENTGAEDKVDHAREKVKSAIVNQLKAHGGSLSSGERGLAKRLGANRSTMRRAINGLVMAGVVVAAATRNGTMLRLVA